MMSRRNLALAVSAAILLGGCSDAPTRPRMPRLDAQRLAATLPTTVRGMIDVLFIGGNVTAVQSRWTTVLESIAAGDMTQAQKLMFDIVKFTLTKQDQEHLKDPDGSGDATVQNGVSKLFSLMFREVFPGEEFPPEIPVGDAVVTLVDGNAQTAVTPERNAGIQISAGSTDTPFILVIDENPQQGTAFLQPCSGPLPTQLCQFPLFYNFTPYPHVRLNRMARFGVCTIGNHGETQHPRGPQSEEQHDRLRLAHPAHPEHNNHPVVDGITIMPLVPIDFLDCEGTDYPLPPIEIGSNPVVHAIRYAAARAGGMIARALTPRSLYAIDRGGGGEDDFFSPFNVVDPASAPMADLNPFTAAASPTLVVPNEGIGYHATIKNIGGAAAPPSSYSFVIASDAALTLNVQVMATLSAPTLPPGDSIHVMLSDTVPPVASGVHYIGIIADQANVVSEIDEANNTTSVQVLVPTLTTDNTFSLTARGTASVDGILDGTEWANGICRALNINAPLPVEGPQPVWAGKLCVMSDANNLYLALSFHRNAETLGKSLAFEFDSDNSGTLSANDDGIILNPGIGFKDLVRYVCELESGPALCSSFDEDRDGSNDGAAVFAALLGGPTSVYEMSHPLNGTDGVDFVRAPGGSIGFFLFNRVVEPDAVFPVGFGDTDWPLFGQFATINLAP